MTEVIGPINVQVAVQLYKFVMGSTACVIKIDNGPVDSPSLPLLDLLLLHTVKLV